MPCWVAVSSSPAQAATAAVRGQYDAFWDQPIIFPASAASVAADSNAILSIEVVLCDVADNGDNLGGNGDLVIGTAAESILALLQESDDASAGIKDIGVDRYIEIPVQRRGRGPLLAVVGGETGAAQTTVILSVTFGQVLGLRETETRVFISVPYLLCSLFFPALVCPPFCCFFAVYLIIA